MQEENQNELQEEGNQPSREEILAASRKENKNGDEMDKQAYNKALQLAYGVGMIIFSVITIVELIVKNKMPLEFWVCYSAIMATQGLYYGIKSSKRRALFLAEGIFGAIVFLFFTVSWILQLCGVIV